MYKYIDAIFPSDRAYGTRVTMEYLKSYALTNRNHLHNLFCSVRRMIQRVLSYVSRLIAVSGRRIANFIGISPTSFTRQFESQHGPSHPKFFEGSLQTAMSNAFEQGKILAVFMYSNRNHSSNTVLTNSLIVEVLDANCIVYAENARGVIIRNLVNELRIKKVPNLSLLLMTNTSKYSLITCIDDFRTTESVLVAIVTAIENPTAAALTAQYQSSEVTVHRNIISEQDEEYKRAVEQDTARLLSRQLSANNDIERRKEREKLALQREQLIAKRKETAKQYSNPSKKGNTKIRVRLPTGCSIEYVFDKEDTVEELYEWVGAAEFLYKKVTRIPYSFDLSIPYPSKTLDCRLQTLEEANLYPNASLVLISRDDSDDDDV